MTRASPSQTSFIAGELSPRFAGRDNLAQYFESLQVCENFLVTQQGSILRRSGTAYLADAKQSDQDVVLIPFVFSVDQSYVFEVSNLAIRVFVSGGRLEDGGSPVEISAPWTEAQLRDIRWAQEANVLYLVHPEHPPYRLTRTDPVTFALEEVSFREARAPMFPDNLDDDITFETTNVSGNTFDVTSVGFRDWTSADIGRYIRISGLDSAGDLANRWLRVLSINSVTSVRCQRFTTGGGPLDVPPTSDWSISPITDAQGFYTVAFHEGRLFYGGSPEAPDRFWASGSDDFDFFEPRLGDPADTAADEPDRAFTRRLVASGVNQIRWMVSTDDRLVIGSASGEFSVEPVSDDVLSNASVRVLAGTNVGSSDVQPVLVSGDVFFVERDGRSIRRSAYSLADDRRVATDSSLLAEHITGPGIARMAYQQAPESILWVALDDGGLVGVTVEREQRVIAFHRQPLAGTYNGGPVRVLDVASIPAGGEDATFFAVRRTINGQTETYIEQMQPTFTPRLKPEATELDRIEALDDAFFLDSGLKRRDPLPISGVTTASPAQVTVSGHGLSNGDMVRVTDLPGMPSLNRREFEVQVVNANAVLLLGSNTLEDPAYTLGGEIHLGFTVFGGLGHLEGETVGILADGAPLPPETVSGGQVTLPLTSYIVTIGLPYVSTARTQRFIGGAQLGTSQGQPARIHEVDVRVLDTLGLEIAAGRDGDFQPVTFRDIDFFMDENLPLFEGDVSAVPDSGWSTEPTVTLRQSAPLPCHVLAIYPRMTTNEG